MHIIERLQGRYEAQQVPFGRVYVWSPGHVLTECNCKKRSIYTNAETFCTGCHMDHSASVLEALGVGRLGDKDVHPWRYDRRREDASIPY